MNKLLCIIVMCAITMAGVAIAADAPGPQPDRMMPPAIASQIVERVFTNFDVNKDGQLSKEEFAKFFVARGREGFGPRGEGPRGVGPQHPDRPERPDGQGRPEVDRPSKGDHGKPEGKPEKPVRPEGKGK